MPLETSLWLLRDGTFHICNLLLYVVPWNSNSTAYYAYIGHIKVGFASEFLLVLYIKYVYMASPRRSPYSPRRPEGGRSPRLALPPLKHCSLKANRSKPVSTF
jgi:hypothetical protein